MNDPGCERCGWVYYKCICPPAEVRAAKIFGMCVTACPNVSWNQCPTSDGGMVVDSERSSTGRDLLFATPNTASIVYFTARTPDERYAGVVTAIAAVPRLARWVATDEDFPREGLLLG